MAIGGLRRGGVEEGDGVICVGMTGRWLISVTLRNTLMTMIKTFRHKGLQAFFETGGKAGIQPDSAPRLRRQLTRLDLAKGAADMNLPGWKLHPLVGDLRGHYAVMVTGNWRMTFAFDGENAILVDYQDYH